MVLWYDPKRQGATNESMAANPVLRDLSGNGHDATCYNFAWSGESGIGSYTQNKFINSSYRRVILAAGWEALSHSYNPNVSWKIKVSCADKPITLEDNVKLFCPDFSDNTWLAALSKPLEDGKITTITPYTGTENVTLLYIDLNSYVGHKVIVEQLPLYPNALVADGVDDYAKVEGLPLLTDYTIIYKRQCLNNSPTGCLFTKKCSYNTDNEGAFQVERYLSSGIGCFNFGGRTDNVIAFEDTKNKTVNYQTKGSFNNTALSVGNAVDTDTLGIFQFATDRPQQTNIYSGALYSVILFNRTLTSEEIEWVKENMVASNEEEVDWYGVEFYTTSPYPDCIRIGNPELHKTLPVHTQMKGVLLSDDGTVNKYLNESDWTSETRDGSQGQVMVEMPKESYWKFETDGNIRRVKFSTKPLPGFQRTPQGYVSAYEAALQRSTNTLCSVVNTDVDYRGGNNNAEWDDTYRSQLGVPASNISLNNFRTYARNRKADSSEWNFMTYNMQKLLYWMFVVEYATLNTQKAFEANKDVDGYAQGGLGNGVTTLNRSKWTAFNDNNPFIPCGYTDELGNGTGEVEFSMPTEYDSAGITVKVPRYRGVENPFGHIWKWTDGCKCLIQSEADGGLSEFYVCDDPAAFTSSGTLNYELRGNLPRKEGYVKKLILGEDGEIMPLEVGAGSTTYFCDYFYTNIPASGVSEHGVLFGGGASNGAYAGFVSAHTSNTATHTPANIGSRLCFIPNNNNN